MWSHVVRVKLQMVSAALHGPIVGVMDVGCLVGPQSHGVIQVACESDRARARNLCGVAERTWCGSGGATRAACAVVAVVDR